MTFEKLSYDKYMAHGIEEHQVKVLDAMDDLTGIRDSRMFGAFASIVTMRQMLTEVVVNEYLKSGLPIKPDTPTVIILSITDKRFKITIGMFNSTLLYSIN